MDTLSKVTLGLAIVQLLWRAILFDESVVIASAELVATTQSDNLWSSQSKLLDMLQATGNKFDSIGLARGPKLAQNCLRFNDTLHGAIRHLGALVKLTGGLRTDQPDDKLHEEDEQSRRLQAQQAYESVGSTISLYFECLAQMGALGVSDDLLEGLLPIAADDRPLQDDDELRFVHQNK